MVCPICGADMVAGQISGRDVAWGPLDLGFFSRLMPALSSKAVPIGHTIPAHRCPDCTVILIEKSYH